MYEIRVSGLLMATKPTRKGALALVTERYHGREHVEIIHKGEIIWTSEKQLA